MNTVSYLLRPLRLLGAAALLGATLTACSTGTDTADTNVERGIDKAPLSPGGLQPSGAADSSRMARDTAMSKQERQYRNTRYRKDRDHDGIADEE